MLSFVNLLLPYAILVLVIVLSLALFVLVKADMRRHGREWERERDRLLAQQLELKGQIAALESIIRERGQQAESTSTATSMDSLRPKINLQRRTQILRLAKRGDNPRQIAAALSLPQNEVALLLKVHTQQSL